MLVLRASMRPIVFSTETLYCRQNSQLNFLPLATSKILLTYFQLFCMKAVKAKCKI